MARLTNRLSARAVATNTTPGMHADGAGLYLNISNTGTKSWRLIYSFAGKRTELGLGSAAATTLAQARSKAAEAQMLVRGGIDPKQARKGLAVSADHSFGAVATELIDGIEAWRH